MSLSSNSAEARDSLPTILPPAPELAHWHALLSRQFATKLPPPEPTDVSHIGAKVKKVPPGAKKRPVKFPPTGPEVGAKPGQIPPGQLDAAVSGSIHADGVIPEGIIPQGVIPEGVIPEGITPQRVIPEGVTPQGVIPQGVTLEGVIPQGNIPFWDATTPSLGLLEDGAALFESARLAPPRVSYSATSPPVSVAASYTPPVLLGASSTPPVSITCPPVGLGLPPSVSVASAPPSPPVSGTTSPAGFGAPPAVSVASAPPSPLVSDAPSTAGFGVPTPVLRTPPPVFCVSSSPRHAGLQLWVRAALEAEHAAVRAFGARILISIKGTLLQDYYYYYCNYTAILLLETPLTLFYLWVRAALEAEHAAVRSFGARIV